MKKIILYSLLSSGILLFAGCNEEWNTGIGKQGKFNPVVTLDTNPISSKSSRSEAPASITVADLHLTLTPDDPKGTPRQWESISDFNVDEKFNVGGYSLEAYYGEKNSEGFNKPYYYGAATFTVRENDTTPVSLTASLGNAMVTPTYSEAFTNYFTNYSVDVKTLAGSVITCAAQEKRPVYVAPGSVQIVVNVVKPNGKEATYQAVTFAAEARHHYNINLDVENGNVGEVSSLVISFDDNLDIEDVVIDLNIDNFAAPTIKYAGFVDQEPITLVAGTRPDNELTYTVSAPAGLASVILETKSTSLKEQGWPETVDLMATPAAVRASMSLLGFKEIGLWNNPDRLGFIDLTDVIENIRYIEAVSNETTFKVSVTDRYNQTAEQDITLAVNIERLNIEIVSAEKIMQYDDKATLDIAYNGGDPDNRVAVEYVNPRTGVWAPLDITSITPKSRASVTYTVIVSGIPSDAVYGNRDVTLRALVKDINGDVMQHSEQVVVNREELPFSLSIDERNVFAYKATAIVANTEKSISQFAGEMKLEMSTDGGKTYAEYDFSVDGDHLIVNGLQPATAYTARIKSDDMHSCPISFTTEAAPQLPNGGMEEWYTAQGATKNQIWHYPYAEGTAAPAWNTYNPVTMSQGSSSLQSNYAYDATSGTIKTTDTHSGSVAAQIRTVGWGSGNTASANSFNRWNFATCKHVAAGQLFLGNWDGVETVSDATPNYGLAFASRPASLSFWYKYAVMNKDGNDNGQKGVAIAQIIDNQGNVLAEQTVLLDPNAKYKDVSSGTDCSVDGNYVQKTLNFSYPFNTAKAEKIVVIFKSTNYTTSELESNKNSNHMRPPKPLNLSDHEYLGSSLLIDDITLNY